MRLDLRTFVLTCLACLACLTAALAAGGSDSAAKDDRSVVHCANLVYGNGKTSTCYSDEFLKDIEQQTHVTTSEHFSPIKLESPDLYHHPFAVMTGEGGFALTQEQRDNLRQYLKGGGFLVASAGCSSEPWIASVRKEIAKVFPEVKLKALPMDHPIFHTVYDIDSLGANHGGTISPLEGLEIDGKIVMILSPDGLNDTAKAGPNCCCCGGNEIHEARKINVNLLTYALTH